MRQRDMIYTAVLKYFDGRQATMPIKGIKHDNGYILVPESIELSNGKRFLLNKKIKVLDYFEYMEYKWPVAPFRGDLH